MGKPSNRCARCSGPLRGRNGRRADIAQMCAVCGSGVCVRHVTWDDARGGWICTKCHRDPSRQPEEETTDA